MDFTGLIQAFLIISNDCVLISSYSFILYARVGNERGFKVIFLLMLFIIFHYYFRRKSSMKKARLMIFSGQMAL